MNQRQRILSSNAPVNVIAGSSYIGSNPIYGNVETNPHKPPAYKKVVAGVPFVKI